MSTYWQQFRSRQLAIEKKFVGEVYNALRKQNIAFLNSIKKNGYAYSVRRIDQIVSPVGIIKVLKKLYRAAAYSEGKYIARSLNKKYIEQKKQGIDAAFGVGFDEIADTVDEYFRVYQISKSGMPITRTTKKYIYRYLVDEVNKGMGVDDAIKNFREVVLDTGPNNTGVSRSRAKTIIQTESLRAMSFGQMIGAYQSGVDCDRVWVTCDDERVRGKNPQYPTNTPHTILDRQVASLFGSFYNGEHIKFPGDPEASTSNTIRCRCTQFFKEKEKPKTRTRTRKLANFLTDFFAGFLMNEAIELLTATTVASGEAQILNDE